MRSELEPVLDQARMLEPAELPRLLGELEEVRATALARLVSPPAESRPDELLDVEATARRMGVSPHYLYHHHRHLPFTRRVGRKLLFSRSGLDKYLQCAKVK